MTMLPPEENNNMGAANQESVPQVPPAQPAPSMNPQAGGPALGASDIPAQPQPGYAPPQQPGYAPPAGGYQQPQPGAGGYQQPPPGYGQAPVQSDPLTTVTLNYWLSVFFTWIPALIFWMIEKDKGNPQATAYHTANLNFSLLRAAVGLVIAIFAWIPILGWIIAGILGIASLGLFILHIITAVSVADNYKRGVAPGFMFNIQIIK